MPPRRYFLVVWLTGWLLSGWLSAAPAQAQRPAAPWLPDPVLSSLMVQELVFGPDGYGWVATDEEVRRYDGYAAVPLSRLVRPGGVPAPRGYTQLAFDRAGQLWIGHETGLYRFAPATGQLTRLALPLAPAELPTVKTIWLDARTGSLWLSYGMGRLLCFDPRRPRLPTRPPPSHTGGWEVLNFAPASGGAVWATAPTAILVLDGHGGLRQHYPSPGFFVVPVPGTRPQQAVSWQALFVVDSATGHLREQQRWLSGSLLFDSRFSPQRNAAGRPTTWLAQGRRIELRWVAGAARPTVRTTGPASRGAVAAPHPDRVYSLARNAAGQCWAFSPGFRGSYRESPLPAVQPLPLAHPLSNPSVRGLARLPDGRLLVSTYGGVFTQAADSPAAPLRAWPLRSLAGLPLIYYDLLVSRAGRVLFAAENGSFGEVNTRTGETREFASAAGSPAPALVRSRALLQDQAGTLWGGAQSGLYQLNEATRCAVRYNSQVLDWPLNQCEVRELAEGAPGTLWLATNHGLYALSPATGALRHYGPTEADPARRLPTADLLSVLVAAPNGPVWLATRDAGLLALDPARGVVRRLTAAQGLPDAPVATLLPGFGGTVWAGTYAGLVRYAPAPDQLTVYGPADGLQEPELNQQAAFRDRDGTLYFGGIGGVFRVAAGGLPAPATVAPRLLFTARTRADSVVQWLPAGAAPAAGLRLPSVSAEAGLGLALTDFGNPSQARFYYRLWPADGTAPGPVQRTTDQHLRLRGLAAGDYALEVWGQTADGQRSAARRVAVLVARPWWQHPAALAGGAALLVGLGAAAQWLRGRRALREARLRTRIAADLHDEVGALLTRVSMRAELLHAKPATVAGPALDALLTDSRAAQASMRDLVWGIDASADTVGALLDRLRDHLDQTAEPAGLHTSLTAHHLPDAQFLAPALRQHLYLLAKEAITNAVRHATHATELRVELGRQGSSFYLRVTDDGTAPSRPGGGGLGLRSMQQRAQAMGGQLTAGPQPGGVGWEVYLALDYRRLAGGG